MSFFDFISAPNVWPFSVALMLLFALSALQIILGFLGVGGDFGLDVDVDVDVDFDSAASGGAFSHLLDWLGIGRVPFLISLLGFLLTFGVTGWIVQDRLLAWTGGMLWWPWMTLGSLAVSIPAVRVLNRFAGRFWPKEIETSALSRDALVGQQAEITLGEIAADSAGQIKVRDPNGAMHHVLAVAENEAERFASGDQLLVVGRRGTHYVVRRYPFPALPSE